MPATFPGYRPLDKSAAAPAAPAAPAGGGLGQALSGLFGMSAAPTLAGSAAAITSGQNQLGLAAGEQQAESGYIGQNLQNQLAQLGISGQQLGIQQAGVGQELNIAPQQYALGQQSRGIQGQGLAAQLAQSQYQQGRAVQNQQGSAAAGGSTSSVGNRRALGDIAQQYGFQQGEIGRSQQQLGITGQQAALSQQEQMGNLQRQQQSLNLSAKSLGISTQQANQQAQQALEQLGLSTTLSVNDIWNGIAQAQAGEYTPLQPILGTVFSMIAGQQPSQPGG